LQVRAATFKYPRALKCKVASCENVMTGERDGEIGFVVAIGVELHDGVVTDKDGAQIAGMAAEIYVSAEEIDDVAELGVERVEVDQVAAGDTGTLEIGNRVAGRASRAAIFQRGENEK